ncbi:MAG: helix-turn-helix domain-containing protein [Dehalococcoidia bacterium]
MTASEAARFDAPSLYGALDAQRRSRGMSWRDVADEIGVSVSTLTGTAKGGRLETDGVMFMLQWLDLPAEAFLRGPAGSPPELMAQISILIRARSDLSPESASALEEIIGDAYQRLRTTHA